MLECHSFHTELCKPRNNFKYTPSLMTFNNDQIRNALYIQIYILNTDVCKVGPLPLIWNSDYKSAVQHYQV